MTSWWKRLIRYAHPHRGQILGLVGLNLITIGLNLLYPWPQALVVDCVLQNRPLPAPARLLAELPGAGDPMGLLGWLIGAMIGLFLVAQAVQWWQAHMRAGVSNRMVYDLARDLFDHLQRLSPKFHQRHPVGDLVQRVIDNTGCVRDLVLWVGLLGLMAILNLVAMFAWMYWLDPVLALTALLVTPPLFLLMRWFAKPMVDVSYEKYNRESEIMALAEQTLVSLPVVQVFNREERIDRRFRRLASRAIRATLRATRQQLQFKLGVDGILACGTATVMILGGLHVLQGKQTVGQLLVFISYLGSLYGPIDSLVYLTVGFSSAAAASRRVNEVLDAPIEIVDRPGAPPSKLPVRGSIEFDNVTFGYEPGKIVLNGLTASVADGEMVALIGATGAGKSTMASLVPRLFDPWEGSVRIDGVDARDWRLADLRAQVSIVLQDPHLLPLSIADNIAYGRPGATRDEIEAAARAAQAERFIQKLPHGYDSLIGEAGATLSGGEKQRLSVARALLRDAPILILDEPTSALDAETEAALVRALDGMRHRRTILIIAHRLSTIERADRVIVMEEGRTVESGTPSELLRKDSRYRHLRQLQTRV
jgi:ATP-binding cassette subfamily B protein/subfamily B ATP-binding cassette protein MsbA